jgi:two-component system, LytTR family, response regulator
MMQYKAIVIDDEENTRNLIRTRIEATYPNIRVVEMCENAKDALMATLREKPDFITLDIQMPETTGLEFLKLLRESNSNTKVLIISAYSDIDYFREGIRLGICDYLVKPFSTEDLQQAIDSVLVRIRTDRGTNHADRIISTVFQEPKIQLKGATSLLFVAVSDIIYAKADGKYTQIFLRNQGSELILQGMNQLCEEFKPHPCLVRIDRSTIVNKQHIKKIVSRQRRLILAADPLEYTITVTSTGVETLLSEMGCS